MGLMTRALESAEASDKVRLLRRAGDLQRAASEGLDEPPAVASSAAAKSSAAARSSAPSVAPGESPTDQKKKRLT